MTRLIIMMLIAATALTAFAGNARADCLVSGAEDSDAAFLCYCVSAQYACKSRMGDDCSAGVGTNENSMIGLVCRP